MRRFLIALTTLLALVSTVAYVQAKVPEMGFNRWQDRAGYGSVDSLLWSDEGDSVRVDTFAGATAETTIVPIDISGVSYLSVWFITSTYGNANELDIVFQPQVSPDAATWLSLTSVYSVASCNDGTAAVYARKDTGAIVLYTANTDTNLTTVRDTGDLVRAYAYDMRRVKAAKYLRFIVYGKSGMDSGDKVMIKAGIVVRQWPLE